MLLTHGVKYEVYLGTDYSLKLKRVNTKNNKLQKANSNLF